MSQWGAFVQPLLQWKSNEYYIFCVCVCSHSYPACNAPYSHLCPLRLYSIFAHYLINGTIFEKNIYSIYYWSENVLFCLQIVTEIFLILTRILWTDFRKILKYRISWKSVKLEPSCSMGTDGHEAFRNFANVAMNICNENQQCAHFLH